MQKMEIRASVQIFYNSILVIASKRQLLSEVGKVVSSASYYKQVN